MKCHRLTRFKKEKGFDEVKARLEIKVLRDVPKASDDSEVRLFILLGKADCSFCWERLCQGVVVAETSCTHMFHSRCIFEWLLRANSCPLCRSSLGWYSNRVLEVQNYVYILASLIISCSFSLRIPNKLF